MDSKPKHWAIVGGGIMGLTAALKLLQKGEQVTVVEAAAEFGGLTASWDYTVNCTDAIQGEIAFEPGNASELTSNLAEHKKVLHWDKYYHVILLSDTKLRSLIDELNLSSKLRWVQTKTGFFSRGKLYSLSSSLDFLRFPPLNLYQKFRLGSTIFLASKIRNWKPLESILVEKWLTKWSGRSTFEKIWRPLLKAKLGEAYRRTASSFIWSYIDRMYKARRSGMKREMFGYVEGGYRTIIEALVAKIKSMGGELRSSAAIQEIVGSPNGHNYTINFDDGERSAITCDRLLLTLPYAPATKIAKFLSDDEKRRMSSTEYLGVICTSMLLDRPLSGYYVTNIIDSDVPLTGIIEMGAIVPPETLAGYYLVYLPQYRLSEDPDFSMSDESIHKRCIETLERMYPHTFNRTQIAAIQTSRTRNVMAIPTLNFSENRPPVALASPGAYLLNSARIVKGNLNVNETLELLDEELSVICDTPTPDR